MADNNIIIIPDPEAGCQPQLVLPVEIDDSCDSGNSGSLQHNDLLGIQGGDATDRYHLDKDQWGAVNGNAHVPSGDNPFVTQAELEGLGTHLSATLVAKLDVPVGGVVDGRTFTTSNTLEEVFRAILIKEIFHTYIQPAFTSFTSDHPSNAVEVGASFPITFTSVYAQHDAGTSGVYTLTRNSVAISNNNPYTDTFSYSNSPVTYVATQQYANGPVINSNLGNASPNPVLAGTISTSNIVITPKRRVFFNTNTSGTIPTTSTQVRALAQSAYSGEVYSDQLTFTITVATGTKSVIFAIPATRTLVSVIFHGSLTNDETAAFTGNTSTVNVEGANSFATTPYTQYWYTAVGTFTSNCTYTVTIQ